MTSVNGTSLTYDANGNVLTYGNMEFEWTNGRVLSEITVNPTDPNGTADVYSYTYDENGIRSSKTVNGTTTSFTTKDGVILSQTDGTNTMYFQYDNSGNPTGFLYNGAQYFYLTNQMGDVIGITDNTGALIATYTYGAWGEVLATTPATTGNSAQLAIAGALIATYTYGAWGEVLATTPATTGNSAQLAIANANPLRYRGYYLDAETGYYYLQSRYYSSLLGRYVNADLFGIALISKDDRVGNNLFLYCSNNPINNNDFDGKATKQQKNKKRASALVNYVIKHASKKNKPIQVFYKKFAGCSVYLGVELNAKANDSSDRLKKQSLGGKTKKKSLSISGAYTVRVSFAGYVFGGTLKNGTHTLRGYYVQGPGSEAFVGSITEKYASNNQTIMYYTIFIGLQINNYTKAAAKVAVVSACAALGSAASYAMGSIAYVAVELAPKITAALMKSVMLREVATQTPNLVSA